MPKAKILVIDDQSFICKLINSRLSANDYNVVSALDGIEGLHKAHKEKPDLILLDITMPRLDGFETARRLKSNDETKSIPIIMLTAKGVQSAIAKATNELGAVSYIVKPFRPEVLIDEIQKALDKKREMD